MACNTSKEQSNDPGIQVHGEMLINGNIIIISSYSFEHLFSMLARFGWFVMKDLQAFLSLAISLLAFFSFRSLLISFHFFLIVLWGKYHLRIIHLLDQTLSTRTFPHALQFYSSPEFLCRHHIAAYSSKHRFVIHLWSDHILLFNWLSLTSIEHTPTYTSRI